MVRLNLLELKEKSKQRPAGYLDEILKLGKPDGNGVFLKDSDYEYLINKYTGSTEDGLDEAKDESKVIPITTTSSGKSENLNNINKDTPVLHVSPI
jgi:hypothetical protein